MKHTITGLIFSTAVAACASGPVEPPTPVEVTVKRMIPSTSNLSTAEMTISLQVTNPRETPVLVDGVTFELASEDEGLGLSGASNVDMGSELPAGGVATLELRQTINLPKGTEAYQAVVTRETIPVLLTGVVRFGDGTETSFSKPGTLAPPNVPTFVVHEAQAASYEGTGIDVTFYLRLINENPFGIVVENAGYEIILEGKKVREGTAGIGVRLPQSGVQEYEVATTIDASSWGKDWKQMLSKETLSYRLAGTLTVNGMDVVLDQTGTIRLN